MGLSSFPTAAEGMLPVLVMNTVLSVALLKDLVRSLVQVVMGANYGISQDYEQHPDEENARKERRVSITQFKSGGGGCDGGAPSSNSGSSSSSIAECCVCLCNFEDEEEVSELSCKHFFHRGCLDKWFDNKHSTCPLCRSVV